MATATTKLMTADEFCDFVHRPENAGKWFELERGEVIELPPPQKPHGFVCANVAFLLMKYAAERKKLIVEMQKRVLDQAYYMPGLWWTRNVVHWTKVKNYVAPPSHYTNQKLQDVWLAED